LPSLPDLLAVSPVILLCMVGDKIRHAYWGWKYRRAERRAIRKRDAHSTGTDTP
jgi:hypothetical protein